jgi:hypothetical protein
LCTDLWTPTDWIVNVSYLDSDYNMGIVHIRRQNIYDRQMLGLELVKSTKQRLPFESLLRCLGKSSSDTFLKEALAPFDWDSGDYDFRNEGEITKYVSKYGITLYFGGQGRQHSVLTGLRFNRRGDMSSKGYSGSMPFGIEFHHTPLEVKALVGRTSDELFQAADTGAMVWRLQSYILHIMYSLIDYQVYRVSIFLNEE